MDLNTREISNLRYLFGGLVVVPEDAKRYSSDLRKFLIDGGHSNEEDTIIQVLHTLESCLSETSDMNDLKKAIRVLINKGGPGFRRASSMLKSAIVRYERKKGKQ